MKSCFFCDWEFQKLLTDVHIDQPLLIDNEISVERKFSIIRSFQRGGTTRLKETKLVEENISINNRWRNFEIRSVSIPNLPMSEGYT